MINVIILVLLVAFLICGYIYSVKFISKNKPKEFPVRNIVLGWLIVIISILTTIFNESGHVLTLAPLLLKIPFIILLSISYILMIKQIYRIQTFCFLFVALLLFSAQLWIISSPSGEYFHSFQRIDNVGRNLAIMIGGSMFIWYPMLYLVKASTREHYNQLNATESGKNQTTL